MLAVCDRRERTGERNVIYVVPRGLGKRPGLTPARHSSVNNARISGKDLVWAQPESLHDAWSETLHYHVGTRAEFKRRSPPFLGANVHLENMTPAINHWIGPAVPPGAINAKHFGTQIRQ